MDGHLGRVWPWDQIGGAEEIQKLLIVQPAPAAHDFVVKQADVRGRAAERGQAQLEEDEENVTQAPGQRFGGGRDGGGVHAHIDTEGRAAA